MGPAESPALAGIQIADLAGGSMQAVIGILLAIEARHRTGRGQRVDVSMFAGSCSLMPVPVSMLTSGRPPERGNDLLSGGYACYQIYPAAGGSFVTVGALEPKFWANLCRELGCEELIAGTILRRPVEVENARSQQIFKRATAEEWFVKPRRERLLRRAGASFERRSSRLSHRADSGIERHARPRRRGCARTWAA